MRSWAGRTSLAGLSVLAAALPGSAQHEHEAASPYAGARSEEVQTLTAQEVADLLGGAGMGLARPAELNGYPGPRHALELADSLSLTPDQEQRTRAIFDAMEERAMALGRRIVEAEKALDTAFAAGADPTALQEHVAGIARLRGELRWTHLRAHLELAAVLTTHQRHLYARLRGYGSTPDH